MSDLSTHINLKNNTSYTLGLVGHTSAHGHWDSGPPSSIGSFDSASFSMKDPSGAAAGSEGTATYQAVVPDTNEEGNNSTINVTFLVRFCDSYSADNNYCYFSTSHPELFAISFEAKTGDGSWNKNYCPESGHPVFLRLFIKSIS